MGEREIIAICSEYYFFEIEPNMRDSFVKCVKEVNLLTPMKWTSICTSCILQHTRIQQLLYYCTDCTISSKSQLNANQAENCSRTIPGHTLMVPTSCSTFCNSSHMQYHLTTVTPFSIIHTRSSNSAMKVTSLLKVTPTQPALLVPSPRLIFPSPPP